MQVPEIVIQHEVLGGERAFLALVSDSNQERTERKKIALEFLSLEHLPETSQTLLKCPTQTSMNHRGKTVFLEFLNNLFSTAL